MPARSHIVGLLVIALGILGIDQLSKIAVVAAIGPHSPSSRIDLAGRWIALEYAENQGAAFGLFAGTTLPLALLSLAIVVGLLAHYFRDREPPIWQTIAVGVISGGAVGNLVDRVRLGHVVDFVSIGPWPNFNFADSAVTIGVLTLAWGWIRSGDGTVDRHGQ